MEILGNYDIKQINGFWHQSNLILLDLQTVCKSTGSSVVK